MTLENDNWSPNYHWRGGNEGVDCTEATYEGMYTLENVDGSDVKVELGNLANGYVQAATATHANLNAMVLMKLMVQVI